jgi:hypothetical protein
MSVWNKILLGLVLVGVLVFFHAALRTLKTFYYWSNQAAKFEAKLKSVHEEIALLRHGDPQGKILGVQQLRFDLDRMLANRGRMWANCAKKSDVRVVNGFLNVTVTTDEGSFTDKTLLYLFEEGDDVSPGKYLGEYTVSSIDNNNNSIVLAGTTHPTRIEEANLRNSKSGMPWVLYEIMPADQHELFASLPEELRKKCFEPDPAAKTAPWLPKEFALDGQMVDGKIFERKLRDYLEIMRACEAERMVYDDRLNSLQRDQDYLSVVRSDSEKQQAFATKARAQALQERTTRRCKKCSASTRRRSRRPLTRTRKRRGKSPASRRRPPSRSTAARGAWRGTAWEQTSLDAV